MGTTRRNRLTELDLDFVSLVAAGDDPMAQVVIAKTAPPENGGAVGNHKREESRDSGPTILPNPINTEERMGTIDKTGLDPDVLDYIEGLETEVETLGSQVEKAEADLTSKDAEIDTLKKSAEDDISKSDEDREKDLLAKADPAVRALIEKQNAQIKRAEDIAKAEREQRLDKEFVAKAEALPNVPGERSELAGLLRRIADSLTPEDSAAVEKAFTALNEQVAKGDLFKSIGHGGGETTLSKSVEARAAELMKSDPALTKEMATVKVYEMDPTLAMKIESGEDN